MLDVVELLVKHGADPHIKSKDGIRAFDDAMDRECHDNIAFFKHM
jgi:hypothetical protein